jgi:hypothetical protein
MTPLSRSGRADDTLLDPLRCSSDARPRCALVNESPATPATEKSATSAFAAVPGSVIDTTDIPRPFVGLRSPLPGRLGYSGETDAQMRSRWVAEEKYEADCKAEEARLWRWKITPIWEISQNAKVCNEPSPELK